MNSLSKGFITTCKLREDLELDNLEPVDLDAVTRHLSIKVIYKDLGDGIEGACKSIGAKRLVVLNPNSRGTLKERFTLAHEIGHLFIHHGSYLCGTDSFFTYKTQNEEEQEANDFAAEFLLPRKAMISALRKNDLNYPEIERISEAYKTSISVAAIRLIKLFQDDAVLLFHDGRRVIWKVRSDTCFLRINDVIPINALAHKINTEKWNVKGHIEAGYWLGNEYDDLLCEEETHYFSKMNKYLTILKFYENN